MGDIVGLVPSTDEQDIWIYASWRLYRNIQVTPNCWIWQGSENNGYGRIYINGRRHLAHRLSYELHHLVKLERSQVIRHKCNNPLCVNPDHLQVGTQQDNINDMITAGRQGFVQKITAQQRKQIRNSNLTLQQLADMYNVSKTTIHRIKKIDKRRK